MTELIDIAGFPSRYKNHRRFVELQSVANTIYHHPAVTLERSESLDNMIRASLLFTVCFYGNLLGCLRGYVNKYLPAHPFAVRENGELLHLLLALTDEELATDNIPISSGVRGPHFVAMVEAAMQAGVDTTPVKTLITSLRRLKATETGSRTAMSQCLTMAGITNPHVQAYMSYSEKCAKDFESALSTVALRELSLSPAFHSLLSRIPDTLQYRSYRIFLKMHIDLDSGEQDNAHSKLVTLALNDVKRIDSSIDTMITFYQYRKNVYDSCLDSTPLY